MGLIVWIIMGALAGWVASLIMKRDGSMGALANIIVGVIGASIGGFVVNNFLGGDVDGITGFNLQSFFVSLLGAIILLAIVNFFTRGKAR